MTRCAVQRHQQPSTSLVLLLLGALVLQSAGQAVILEVIETAPTLALRDKTFQVAADFSFAPMAEYPNTTRVYWFVERNDKLLHSGSFSALDSFGALQTSATFNISDNSLGYHKYTLTLGLEELCTETVCSSQIFRTHVIPGGVTLLPPLLTIVTVVTTKNVLLSLYIGVFMASFIIYRFNPISAFARSFDTILVDAFADRGHVQVILFTWFLSGMIACVLKAGGGEGLVKTLASYASTPRAAALATMMLGISIFFDGIANTLIVGQTVRPITDALRVSREKLAFIVDGTSSPITSISPISTWVGFELSLIEKTMQALADSGEDITCYDSSSFIIFLKTIPGRFYPFAIMSLQLFLIITGREFGPMHKAERTARKHGVLASGAAAENTVSDFAGLEPEPDTPARWWNAIVPMVTTTLFVIIGLIVTGLDNCNKLGLDTTAENIFGQSDSYQSLLYGSVLGSLAIFLLCWVQRVDTSGELHWFGPRRFRPILTLSQSLDVWISGIQSLTFAVLILLLAWSVGDAFSTCGTGLFISAALEDNVDAGAYPALTFIVASVLAVVTGSSWGAMAIMFPLILPAAHAAAPCNKDVFYGTIASILAGAVFGDHCSPISDTTILSSISCRCDLTVHVKTQAPYALLCGFFCVFAGEFPAGYGAYSAAVGLVLTILLTLVSAYFLTAAIDGTEDDRLTQAYCVMQGLIRKHVYKIEPSTQEPSHDEEAAVAASPSSTASSEHEPLVGNSHV